MLRALFISLSKAHWAQKLITRWKFAWRMASRFIAGETHEDALAVVAQLNKQGILATLDHLGEHTEDRASATQSTVDVCTALDAIHRAGLRSNVSIKLSQLGSGIDPEMTFSNLLTILDRASQNGNFVRVDMEDSSMTGMTIDMVDRAQAEGYRNVGTVIQSYLYRSAQDVEGLTDKGIKIRLVKGAYQEPATVAFPRKKDVDTAFDRLVDELLAVEKNANAPGGSADGLSPPLTAIGSHDPSRIEYAQSKLAALGLPQSSIEFQFLYGIRRDLQTALTQAGYPVRVYVPYGTHWYPYFMRRLAERPANVWFMISSFMKK